jgi:hypothetical protein
MTWLQNYDPLHNAPLSTLLAATPVVALLGLIAWGKMPIHKAAIAALLLALGVAIWGYDMPASAAAMAAVNGACYGLLPIGWMVVNIIFLYKLTVDKGWFEVLKNQLVRLALGGAAAAAAAQKRRPRIQRRRARNQAGHGQGRAGARGRGAMAAGGGGGGGMQPRG